MPQSIYLPSVYEPNTLRSVEKQKKGRTYSLINYIKVFFFTQKCNFALVFGTVDRLSSNLWGGFIEFLVNKSLTATHVRLFLPRYENFFDYIYIFRRHGDFEAKNCKPASI